MSHIATPRWESMRTDESRQVEQLLLNNGFEKVDAYRYNSASIRLRVVDSKFEGLSREERDAAVEPILAQLPERTQADIMTLFTFAPSELEPSARMFRELHLNAEFDEPTESIL